jgi:hypothetical protein
MGNGGLYLFCLLQSFFSIFIIQSILLGAIQEQYNRVYTEQLDNDLKGRDTVILAMEMVSDPTQLNYNNLKDLALENLYAEEEKAKKKLKMDVIHEKDEEESMENDEEPVRVHHRHHHRVHHHRQHHKHTNDTPKNEDQIKLIPSSVPTK